MIISLLILGMGAGAVVVLSKVMPDNMKETFMLTPLG